MSDFGLPVPPWGKFENGYRIGKAQKKAFDEIKVLRAKGLERRAVNLPPEDQRRMALISSKAFFWALPMR